MRGWLVVLALVVLPLAAYWNSLATPFVLDDAPSIRDNPSIRTLWPLTVPLRPPAGGLPVSGRPLANLTLAFNYAVSGEAPWSYHAFNLLLHTGNALLLFALLRGVLRQAAGERGARPCGDALALGVAAVWAVHPLTTATVTYVSQRTELLATAGLLATLHAFARSLRGPGSGTGWRIAALAACLAGMACKETMAAAPVLVFLYDRTFGAGTVAGAWRQRWRWHLAFAATWLLLGGLMLATASRGGTAGLDTPVAPLAYALTQTEAIVRYLVLSVWPHPLVFDFGEHLTRDPLVYGPAGLAVVGLLAAWAVALVRRPVLGFAGAVFFGVLAPTTSIVPVATQTMAEHRMYLPLAVVLTLLAVAGRRLPGRAALAVTVLAVVAAGTLTAVRNRDYRTVETLWRDTVEKRPANVRAHNNLAAALLESGRTEEGLAVLARARELAPENADLLRNLAQALLKQGRASEAWPPIAAAQRIDPASGGGWLLYGVIARQTGRDEEAIDGLRSALRRDAGAAAARQNLAELLAARRDFAGALEQYEALRQAGRETAETAAGRAAALFQLERYDEAGEAYRAVLRLDAAYPDAHFGLGNAFLQAGRAGEALVEFDAALRVDGPNAPRLCARAAALLELGRRAEARQAIGEALRLEPDYPPALELRRAAGW